jgi:hypothetical protein
LIVILLILQTALYGKCTAQDHCTGLGRRWTWSEADNSFKCEQFYPYARSELEWLEWVMESEHIKIKHRWNSGHILKQCGKFPDGYDPKTRTCYFFDGCYWHSHDCHLTRSVDSESLFPDDWKRRSQKDYAIRQELRNNGYNVVEMKECEWLEWKATNDELKVVCLKYLIYL